jgi:hypothetical protein
MPVCELALVKKRSPSLRTRETLVQCVAVAATAKADPSGQIVIILGVFVGGCRAADIAPRGAIEYAQGLEAR